VKDIEHLENPSFTPKRMSGPPGPTALHFDPDAISHGGRYTHMMHGWWRKELTSPETGRTLSILYGDRSSEIEIEPQVFVPARRLIAMPGELLVFCNAVSLRNADEVASYIAMVRGAWEDVRRLSAETTAGAAEMAGTAQGVSYEDQVKYGEKGVSLRVHGTTFRAPSDVEAFLGAILHAWGGVIRMRAR